MGFSSLLLLCLVSLQFTFKIGHCSLYSAIFVFGDSLLDAGNNDKLNTFAKADRLPYGQDFTGRRPTGRFCNGPLSVDYVAALAGLPYPPAYLKAGDNILQGANFASAGAGILNSTGDIFGQHLSFSNQVGCFAELRQRWVGMKGEEWAMWSLSRSLFVIFIGNNDYLVNYFSFPLSNSTLRQLYTPDAFRDLLIAQYQARLMALYGMGARKFAVVSIPPVSCIPLELLLRNSRHGECDPEINQQAQSFNEALLLLADQLQQSLADVHVVYLNSYDLTWRAITDPAAYGFVYGHQACCGAGPYGGVPCLSKSFTKVCKNTSEYVFWDMAHPTSAFNTLVANTFWAGEPPDVLPFNLLHLATV